AGRAGASPPHPPLPRPAPWRAGRPPPPPSSRFRGRRRGAPRPRSRAPMTPRGRHEPPPISVNPPSTISRHRRSAVAMAHRATITGDGRGSDGAEDLPRRGAFPLRATVTIAPRLALDARGRVREGECANPARTLSHAAGLVRHRVGPPPQRSDPTRQPPWTWHGRVYVCWRVHTVFASVEPSAERRRKRGAQRLVSAGHLAIVTGPDGLAEGEIAIVRRSPQGAKSVVVELTSVTRPCIFFGEPEFLDNQRSVKSLTHLSRFAPLKSGQG